MNAPARPDPYECRVFAVTPEGVATDTGERQPPTRLHYTIWATHRAPGESPWPPSPYAHFAGRGAEFRPGAAS